MVECALEICGVIGELGHCLISRQSLVRGDSASWHIVELVRTDKVVHQWFHKAVVDLVLKHLIDLLVLALSVLIKVSRNSPNRRAYIVCLIRFDVFVIEDRED